MIGTAPAMHLLDVRIEAYLFPLPAENSSEYVPFPRITRSPDLHTVQLLH